MGTAAALQPAIGTGISDKALKRYRDAYRVARFVRGMGTALKIVGVVFGMATASFWLVAAAIATSVANNPFGNRAPDASGLLWVVAVMAGALVWFVFFVFGVLVSAQGQQLLATLDAAVHSSPFMDTAAKAEAMSLS